MQKPTNPLWYLAALVIALGSWMVATVVAAGAWEPVRQTTVTQVGPAIDSQGSSLAVFTDLVQPDRSITCQAAGPGKTTTVVKPATIDITVDTDGTPWTLIGLLDQGRDGVKVTCTPKDKRVDEADYGYAVIDGFESRANTGQGIAILGSVAGLGLAGYMFYHRRQRKGERS